MNDIDYDALDPGIREVVRLLRKAGLETTDSGDGVTKGVDGLSRPHVVIRSSVDHHLISDSWCALRTLRNAGVVFELTPEEIDRLQNGGPTGALRQVEATYDPVSCVALVTVWGVTDADLRGVP